MKDEFIMDNKDKPLEISSEEYISGIWNPITNRTFGDELKYSEYQKLFIMKKDVEQ